MTKKKELRIKENESIQNWIDRISEALELTEKQKEAVKEIAKESYIKGSNNVADAIGAIRLDYTIEYVDNGVIIRDNMTPWIQVEKNDANGKDTPCGETFGKMIFEDLNRIIENCIDDDYFIGFNLKINIQHLAQTT